MSISSKPSNLIAEKKEKEHHLIFLPGLHGTAELYDTLVEQLNLQTKFTEVCFHSTLISYPPNIKQDYKKLFKWLSFHLGLEQPDSDSKAIIIAESFSTPLALKLADKFPEQIKAVIIGSGFCSSPAYFGIGLTLLPLRPLFIITPPRSAVRHLLTGSETPPELTQQVRSAITKVSSKTFTQRIRSVLTLNEEQTPTIKKTPILLLQAEHDALIPWEIQNQLERHLSHAEIHWLDSPHLIFQAQPEICAAYIMNFLAKFTP